jgi:gluconokinase
MGVCGCGKSTVAKLLADRLNFTFIEGDTFHPASNIEKMKQAIPLTDEDRAGWLEAISVKTIVIKIYHVFYMLFQ